MILYWRHHARTILRGTAALATSSLLCAQAADLGPAEISLGSDATRQTIANVVQAGNYNNARVSQHGPGHQANVLQSAQYGDIRLQQTSGAARGGNVADLRQTSGSHNLIDAVQNGTANRLNVTQSGVANEVSSVQIGHAHHADVQQYGNWNYAQVRQIGGREATFITQYGDFNVARAIQH
ncbi:hypothetical protein FOZ76_21980 [Verticiella sediminum]|uniref:Curlin n=1 Tax=Verticiella sediminum TaxID=1247510 RepID=A0A556AC86_9BURK|nr:hypothetical protein [Verticiella sediminum]TSH90483.1 hypothetical protein FOZ76_21980 [Verticiella sediminum]